jgi:hypothetical protein
MVKSIAQYIEEQKNHSTEDHNIYVGTTPPPPPNNDGDLWYNPVENRYYAYVT